MFEAGPYERGPVPRAAGDHGGIGALSLTVRGLAF